MHPLFSLPGDDLDFTRSFGCSVCLACTRFPMMGSGREHFYFWSPKQLFAKLLADSREVIPVKVTGSHAIPVSKVSFPWDIFSFEVFEEVLAACQPRDTDIDGIPVYDSRGFETVVLHFSTSTILQGASHVVEEVRCLRIEFVYGPDMRAGLSTDTELYSPWQPILFYHLGYFGGIINCHCQYLISFTLKRVGGIKRVVYSYSHNIAHII